MNESARQGNYNNYIIYYTSYRIDIRVSKLQLPTYNENPKKNFGQTAYFGTFLYLVKLSIGGHHQLKKPALKAAV